MNAIDDQDVVEIDENPDSESKQASGADVAADTLRILEALLFASDELLSAARIKAILPDNPDARQIRKMVDKINVQLQKERHPFEIVEIGGGYQFRTVAYYHPWVRQIFKEKAAKKLSLQALECLAVIAYKQPVSKAEIEAVRGVVSDGAMKTLLEKKLVTISGRSDKPGKPLQYSTTNEFLKYFGLNKIDDLPRIEEFEAIAREKIEDLSFEELTGEKVEEDQSSTDSEDQQSLAEQQEPAVCEVTEPPEPTAVFEVSDLVDSGESESDSSGAQNKELLEQEFDLDASDADSESYSELGQPIEVVENEPLLAPEPTAVFEIHGFMDSVEEDLLENNYSSPINEREHKDDNPNLDSDIQTKKSDMTVNQAQDQDLNEIETVEINVDEAVQSDTDCEEPVKQSVAKKKESEGGVSQTVQSDLKAQQQEELLEVFIPEKPDADSENENSVQQKKNFFSKILKKKNEESEE